MSLSGRVGASAKDGQQPLIPRFRQFADARSNLRASLFGLGWKQWLALFVTGLLIIVIELRNHASMWQAHQSGQTFWTDRELIWEVIVYGLIMPIVLGVILGHLSRTAAERDRVSKELALRRELVRQVGQSQTWHELAEHLVTTPGAVVPAEHAWLFAQPSGTEGFQEMAHWQRLESEVLPSFSIKAPEVCTRCIEENAWQDKRLWSCPHPDQAGGHSPVNRYCLFLSTESTRMASLLFMLPHDRPLEASEMVVLEELGNEMSLAIDKANLRVLRQNQVDIAVNERMRIARDLHDTVGQNVTYLRLKLEQLNTEQLTSDGAEFQDVLANMLTVADETYVQVRDTLTALRSQEHLAVEEVIRQYATQAAERSGFSVHVHSSGPVGKLSAEQSRQVAFIAREALNNVEKHAAARNVDIHLGWQDGGLNLTVRDDGQGFDPGESERINKHGIAIMAERSQLIDANLAISSAPGEGTEVTLDLPLTQRSSPLPTE